MHNKCLLTVWHLLFIKQKWIIQVFILICMLSSLKRRRERSCSSCCLRGGRGGRRGRRGRLRQCNLTNTSYFFCICILISLKMFLCSTNPSFTVCFSFSAYIVDNPGHKRSWKQSWVIKALLPGCPTSACCLVLLLPCLPHRLALAGKCSSPSSHCLSIPLMYHLLAFEFL